MKPDPDRLKETFTQALGIKSPAERERYLAEACKGQPELRAQVESLLRAHEQAGDFLGQTIPLPSSDFEMQPPGTMIGRYKLLEKIGEGGFGVVYMAEQQEPVQRKVALKIIKPGMDTREVIARFEAERQALALMDHPNIARVLDGGATEAGRPYFVMELVRGIAITDYCDQNHLATTQRLQLFIKVCQAVQHAHQKAVIHRDLKPSNILVTLHDGEPVPKVIDFGVAKALGQKLTQKTLLTAFRQMIGTPAYMSPEQADLGGLDIDTRADIYSLGVLLYELLTGVTPFDRETLAKAALDEIRRMIRETEPPKPSTRLRALGGKLTEVAKHRHTEPAALSRLVRGDLDWIAMKCLEKDRTRRYETANGLASDLNRFLNDEPVSAAAPSALYRAQKFVRRHKAALAVATGFIVLVTAGALVSTLQALRATRAERAQRQLLQQAEQAHANEVRLRLQAEADEKKAKTEATKSQQVAQFLQNMLHGVAPSVALGRDTRMLREILDKTAESIAKGLKDQPEVEADLRDTLGKTYCDLALFPQAEAMHREALRLCNSIFGNEHPRVATSLDNLAYVLWKQGKLPEAETIQKEALGMRKKSLGNEHPDVAISLAHLADVLAAQGKPVEAEAVQREALAMEKKFFGREHPEVAISLNTLAMALMDQGRLMEAETAEREALAISLKLQKEDPQVANHLDLLAAVLWKQGKVQEAESLYRESLAMRRRLLGNEHMAVSGTLNNLAVLLRNQNRLDEAEATYREALAISQKLQKEHQFVANQLNNLGLVLRKQGKLIDAEPLYRESLAMREKLLGRKHPDVAWSRNDLATLLQEQGRLAEAEAMLREALTDLPKPSPKEPSLENWLLGLILHHLANVRRERNMLIEARSLAKEAVAMYERHSDWAMIERQHARQVLGAVLNDIGDSAGLEALLREALETDRKTWATEPGKWEDSLGTLVDFLMDEGHSTEVEPVLSELLTPAVANQPQSAGLLRIRAEFFARRGRWKDATADISKATEFDPTNPLLYETLLPLLAANGDLQGFHEYGARILRQFGETKDPLIAEKMATSCLLVPSSEVDLRIISRLADTAVTAGKKNKELPRAQLAKGLAEYRQSQFQSALEWVRRALEGPRGKPAKSFDADFEAQAYAVLAMVQHQLKQTDDARAALAKGAEKAAKLATLDSGDIGNGWRNWIIVHGLMKEAKALIEGQATSPSNQSKEK